MGQSNTTTPALRKLSNRELADLPNHWDNSGIDTSKYIPSAIEAYEVSQATYDHLKSRGYMCQIHNNRYYVA